MSCRKATTASTYGMGFPAMFAKTGRGRRHDAPVWRNSNFVGGHSICPRPDVKLLFHYFIRFHARFFFVSAGAKKKLTKRNAVKEMR